MAIGSGGNGGARRQGEAQSGLGHGLTAMAGQGN